MSNLLPWSSKSFIQMIKDCFCLHLYKLSFSNHAGKHYLFILLQIINLYYYKLDYNINNILHKCISFYFIFIKYIFFININLKYEIPNLIINHNNIKYLFLICLYNTHINLYKYTQYTYFILFHTYNRFYIRIILIQIICIYLFIYLFI